MPRSVDGRGICGTKRFHLLPSVRWLLVSKSSRRTTLSCTPRWPMSLWGMEEGNNKFSAERVDRNILPDGVEYVVYSKRDGPAGMRMTVRSPKECVFTIGGMRTDGKLITLDFNKTTNLRYATPRGTFAYH